MKSLKDQILAELPKDKPERARISLYVSATLYRAMVRTAGKGNVSKVTERLWQAFLGEKK
jgi:hypothetical protein